jgi:hypothetical protein
MAETIKGGAYQNPDGTWHDANGKRIPPPTLPKPEPAPDLPPLPVMSSAEDEYAKKPEPVAEEKVKPKRRSKKKG